MRGRAAARGSRAAGRWAAATAAALAAAAWAALAWAASARAAAAPPDSTYDLRGGATEAHADSLRRAAELPAWLPREAADDSLAAYWRRVDRGWEATIPYDLTRFDLGPAKLDSLTRIGDRLVEDIEAGRRWRIDLDPLGRVTFNRAEGLRLGSQVTIARAGLNRARLRLGAGYGLASEQAVYDAALTVPVSVAGPDTARGRVPRPPWTRLALRLAYGRTVRMFGGDQRPARVATGFFYGSDPNSYFAERSGRAELVWRPALPVSARVGALAIDQEPLPLETTWNLLSANKVDVNWQIPSLEAWGATTGLGLTLGRWRVGAGLDWYRVHGDEVLARLSGPPEHADFVRLWLDFEGSRLDRHGNELLLRGSWMRMDRQAPMQWRTYLGDYPTLRGYPAHELSGEMGAYASADWRLGTDLFDALGVPVLDGLALQPIFFADWGLTVARDGPYADPPAAGLGDGWRLDAGFGLGRLIGLPLLDGNLRLYAAYPLREGREGDAWHFVLVMEK